jgi:hypothetical protein
LKNTRSCVLGDDARERDRQIVPQREIRLAARLVLPAAQDLEDEPVAFFAVLAEQRLDVLEGRRFERLEALALVDLAHDAHHVLAAADLVRQKIARVPRRSDAAWRGRAGR